MRKGLLSLVAVLIVGLIISPCAWGKAKTIKVGINAPITGDIPKVGEGTKFAAQMWLADINAAGGLEVGGKKYPVELVIEDNESKAESAVKVQTKMITEDEVLVIVGPQSSKQAIPAGEVANNYGTPMISPWSTNPNTTLDRPWVFRAAFLDPFQGPVFANFAGKKFGAKTAPVLYDVNNDYSVGLAEVFKSAWEAKGLGPVVAYESNGTKDQDFSAQLTTIIAAKPDFIFVPENYNQVALIIHMQCVRPFELHRNNGWIRPGRYNEIVFELALVPMKHQVNAQ